MSEVSPRPLGTEEFPIRGMGRHPPACNKPLACGGTHLQEEMKVEVLGA